MSQRSVASPTRKRRHAQDDEEDDDYVDDEEEQPYNPSKMTRTKF